MSGFKNICLQILIISYFAFAAQGQAANIPVEDEYQALERPFELNRVSKPQLDLFQKKSIQMIKDLMSTLELTTNPNFDESFKSKLKAQALDYFTSPKDSLLFLHKDKLSGLTIENLLNNDKRIKGYFSNYKASNFDFSSTDFSNKKYTWVVTFQIKNQNKILQSFKVNCVLEKEVKSFGRNKKKVWGVFLKSIIEEKK